MATGVSQQDSNFLTLKNMKSDTIKQLFKNKYFLGTLAVAVVAGAWYWFDPTNSAIRNVAETTGEDKTTLKTVAKTADGKVKLKAWSGAIKAAKPEFIIARNAGVVYNTQTGNAVAIGKYASAAAAAAAAANRYVYRNCCI